MIASNCHLSLGQKGLRHASFLLTNGFLPEPPKPSFLFLAKPLKVTTHVLTSARLQALSAFILPVLPRGLHTALRFPLPFCLQILLPGLDPRLIIHTLARIGGEAVRSAGFLSPFVSRGSVQTSSEKSSLNNLLFSFDHRILFSLEPCSQAVTLIHFRRTFFWLVVCLPEY